MLKGEAPLTVRPGEVLAPADLDRLREEVAAKVGHAITDYQLASYLMYPRVYLDYAVERARIQ